MAPIIKWINSGLPRLKYQNTEHSSHPQRAPPVPSFPGPIIRNSTITPTTRTTTRRLTNSSISIPAICSSTSRSGIVIEVPTSGKPGPKSSFCLILFVKSPSPSTTRTLRISPKAPSSFSSSTTSSRWSCATLTLDLRKGYRIWRRCGDNCPRRRNTGMCSGVSSKSSPKPRTPGIVRIVMIE